MTAVACPDCRAVTPPSPLEHADTCPLGRAVDELCAQDRQWFHDHPDADHFWRPLAPVEIASLRMLGEVPDDGQVVGRVQVVNLPGVGRVRRFHADYVVIGGDAA